MDPGHALSQSSPKRSLPTQQQQQPQQQSQTVDQLRRLIRQPARLTQTTTAVSENLLSQFDLPTRDGFVLELVPSKTSSHVQPALAVLSSGVCGRWTQQHATTTTTETAGTQTGKSQTGKSETGKSETKKHRIERSKSVGPVSLWVMSNRQIYVPALASLNHMTTHNDRSLWVFPRTPQEALFACERAARCRGVDRVIADVAKANVTELRRIKIATEAGGGLVVLWRPAAAEREASWADARLRVSRFAADAGPPANTHQPEHRNPEHPNPEHPSPEHHNAKGRNNEKPLAYRPRLRVDVLYQKGLVEPRSYMLSWKCDDDSFPVVSKLADSVIAERSDSKQPSDGREPERRRTRRRRRLERAG